MAYHAGDEATTPRYAPRIGGAAASSEDAGAGGCGHRKVATPAGPASAPPDRDPEKLITVLEVTPRELARIIDAESRERLSRPASDGGWAVGELLPHIGDWEAVLALWLTRYLNEETPRLKPVDDSLWPIEHDYASEDPFAALERFTEARRRLVEVARGLGDDDWTRAAVHPDHGPLTLHQFLAWICDHDARYLAQVRDALA